MTGDNSLVSAVLSVITVFPLVHFSFNGMCEPYKLLLTNQKSGFHGQPVTALKLRQSFQGIHEDILENGISAAESVIVHAKNSLTSS